MNLAAVFYLIGLILFVIGAVFLYAHPVSGRISMAGLACVSAGLFCSATGLGG